MFSYHRIWASLHNRRAQILLPAVMLAPIFILVVYLLFETAKVSMTKVRQQFALDNAAYSQVSAASTYLNAMAMVNGPLPYRVMQYYATDIEPLDPKTQGQPKVTVFELFYKGGGVPTIGPDYETGINKPPVAESIDWGLKYYNGDDMENDARRTDWEKENPAPASDEPIPVISKNLVDNYFFVIDPTNHDSVGFAAVMAYLETYARVGSIYKSQDYVYKEVSKNAFMFREAYYLNVNDCKRSDCARQSAAQLRQMLELKTKPFDINEIKFYFTESDPQHSYHGGSYDISFKAPEFFNGEKLFQFAYLDPASRNRLRAFSRGVLLKQSFKLPRNHFNINLEQKYKPYVRTRVVLSCPRAGNNCVWPNPLPKYNVTLEP